MPRGGALISKLQVTIIMSVATRTVVVGVARFHCSDRASTGAHCLRVQRSIARARTCGAQALRGPSEKPLMTILGVAR